MSSDDLDIRLGLLMVFHPAAVRALTALGFDLALEHDRTFEEACAMRDLDPDFVWGEVLEAEIGTITRQDADWAIMQPALTRFPEWNPAAFLPQEVNTGSIALPAPRRPQAPKAPRHSTLPWVA